jgi:NYN domain
MESSDRWMMFVDGENLTMRSREALPGDVLTGLDSGNYPNHYHKDVFLWLPDTNNARSPHLNGVHATDAGSPAIRSYFYTSSVGDDAKLNDIRMRLKVLQFEPRVFKKSKDRGSKGVDITLTKDMLSHCYHNHFDYAVLCTGDQDYVPLIDEVKRHGKRVILWFFENAVSIPLKLASDRFVDITAAFANAWVHEIHSGR